MHALSASTVERAIAAGAVFGAFLTSVIPFAALGAEGLWWTKILFTAGCPLAIPAAFLAAIFGRPILSSPRRWSAVAALLVVLISTVLLWLATDTFVGVVSIPSAAIAAVVFCFIVETGKRAITPRAPPATPPAT